MAKSSQVLSMVNSIERSIKVVTPNWGDFERAGVEQLRAWLDEVEDIGYLADQLAKVFAKEIAIKKNQLND
jgi:hypothetical protein